MSYLERFCKFQIDSLNKLIEEENEKRSEIQTELNTVISELTALKTKEQQLKSDYNRSLEERKQLQEAFNRLKK